MYEKKLPIAQDAFQPMPGLINCTGVTGHVHVHVLLCLVCLTLLASFFLPSHLSVNNMYMYIQCMCMMYMSLCVSYKCTYIVHVQEGVMTYFVGEQFDEFVEEAKLSQLLMEPLATVLDTRLQQLQWKRGGGGGGGEERQRAEERERERERQGTVKSQNKTRLIVEGSRRGV